MKSKTTIKPDVMLHDSSDKDHKSTYNNYQLWRLLPNSENDIKILEAYSKTEDGQSLDWWRGPSLKLVYYRVS